MLNREIPFSLMKSMGRLTSRRGGDQLEQQHYDPELHHRKSLRLPAYDYASGGAYFITICTLERKPFLDNPELRTILEDTWQALPQRFVGLTLGDFVIMPDHVHFIVWLDSEVAGVSALGDIVGAYKPLTTVTWIHHLKTQGQSSTYPSRLWQRNYYEHVIRSEFELEQTHACFR